jgi:hypothetical protein
MWYSHGLSLILTIPNAGSVNPGSNLGCYLGLVSQDESFYVVEGTPKHGTRPTYPHPGVSGGTYDVGWPLATDQTVENVLGSAVLTYSA